MFFVFPKPFDKTMDQIDFLKQLLEKHTDFSMEWITRMDDCGYEWTYRCLVSEELFLTKYECIFDFVKQELDSSDRELNRINNDNEDE
jgi:hypothetical protein